MKSYGFKINKIVVTGEGKEDAFLEFKNGLNVISGASDTGKTYIFESLNYMMGGKENPKEIAEGFGYQDIFIEIADSNQKKYTFKRNISDGKMFLYEDTYEQKDSKAPTQIVEKHDANDSNNISSILLELCNVKYKNVVKNKVGKIESFTFRDFARVIMSSEEEIISKKSVLLGSLGPMKYTRNKNAFKTIITGVEDKGTNFTEEKKITNIKIDAKIEMINSIIDKYIEEISWLNLKIEINKTKVSEIEYIINGIENIINGKRKILNYVDERRQLLFKSSSSDRELLDYNKEVIKKFKLLKDNYISDLKRIEFVDDANYYINQLDNVQCPICLSSVEEVKVDIENISIGIIAEKNKLKKKLVEIDETIKTIEEKNKVIEKEYEKKVKEIDKLTDEMNEELKPIIDVKINELKNLLNKRDELNKKEYIESRLSEAIKKRGELIDDKIESSTGEVEIHKIDDIELADLEKNVATLLKEWNLFEDPQVRFDLKDFDLVINDKKKSSFGKGYRAIINSALLISVMNYNTEKNLPHPEVIIIDSPLTTFKEKDNEDEEVSNVVKKSFYKYLANNFKNSQLIIFENVEPDEELYKIIQYYHFSKSNNVGRYGFFKK